ncbi:MAG TPA: LysR substrate-binding domain-containing protein [Gaiellaceae bacterium]|nr:LysR substrate-binding domain-containing protein [Gaiellaceae bacterium]
MERDRSGPHDWHGVEVRHLAALQAIAAERSFGRAAERLGYTQSAVSQQIATLERLVGERLVDRPGGPRPVGLTDAGRLLLRHADSIVARLQAAQADLHALRAGEAGSVRVGAFQSVGVRVLPEIMRRFRERLPAVEVMLEELDDEDMPAAIERGDVDVGFVLLPVGDAPLETIDILHDGYALVAPKGSALVGREPPPTLAEIAAEPLVGFRRTRSTEPVEAAFHAAGIEPRFAFRSNDNGTVQGLVAAGLALAILPRLTIDETDPRIATVDLGDAIAPRLIAIARHRDRYLSPAGRAFVETAVAATRR